jgi:hypothetical protein
MLNTSATHRASYWRHRSFLFEPYDAASIHYTYADQTAKRLVTLLETLIIIRHIAGGNIKKRRFILRRRMAMLCPAFHFNTAAARNIMKLTHSLICVILMVISNPCLAGDDLNREWFACQSDNECVLVPVSSCFEQSAVNPSYLDNYTAYKNKYERLAECARPQPDNPNAIAKCEKNKCTLAVPTTK